MLDAYDAEFRRRGLDGAVWGHVSDGNVHPNVLPRTFAKRRNCSLLLLLLLLLLD